MNRENRRKREVSLFTTSPPPPSSHARGWDPSKFDHLRKRARQPGDNKMITREYTGNYRNDNDEENDDNNGDSGDEETLGGVSEESERRG